MRAHFLGHDSTGGGVLDLLHAPAVSLPQLLQIFQILISQVELDLGVHVEIGQCV